MNILMNTSTEKQSSFLNIFFNDLSFLGLH